MTSMPLRHVLARARPRLGFCARFAAYAAGLAITFNYWDDSVGPLYLYPLSTAAAAVLNAIGVATAVDAGPLASGLCILTMERAVFHITYECTGITALLIYAAAVLAHPTCGSRRLVGLAIGVAALFAYGVLRLVILALVARFWPAQTQFFHVYLLVFMNVGFMLFLWAWWARRAGPPGAIGP